VIKKAAKQGTAIVLALLFAFEIKVMILTAIFGETFAIVVNPIFDMIVSGIFMSRGANYLSDIVRMIYNVGTKQDVYDLDGFDYDDDEEEEDEFTDEGEEA
jgi:hypothetical protein